jgi:hypothetical protein
MAWWTSARRSVRMRRRRKFLSQAKVRSTGQRMVPRRGDAAGADQAAVLVVVVAAVGVEPARPAPGLADRAADRWDDVEQRDQLGDVVAVAAGQRDRERVPVASVIRWCLEPGLRRSTGLGPVWSPL